MAEQDTSVNAVQDDASVVADAAGVQDDSKAVADALDTTTGDPTTWNFSEGVAGEGEIPEWFKSDKYTTVADQAKAYKDLESRFGAFTGSPEEFAPTELSAELKELGIEIAEDDPLVEKAIAFAKESNMSQEGFNQMINLYAETQAAETQALEAYREEEMKALGNNADTRIKNLNAWASANMTPEMVEGFQGLAQSADAVKTLERLVAMTRSAPISPNVPASQQGLTAADITKMQFEKDEHGNRRINTDKEFNKQYQEAANKFYGTEDHTIVIG